MICTRCKGDKDISKFPLRRKSKRGFSSWCKDCANEYGREWSQRNKKKRNEQIKKWNKGKGRFNRALISSRTCAKRYGYMPCIASVEEIKAAFTGCCHICKISETECKRCLELDHCHITGAFRGWLCKICNVKLGGSWDSEEILLNALRYVRKEK